MLCFGKDLCLSLETGWCIVRPDMTDLTPRRWHITTGGELDLPSSERVPRHDERLQSWQYVSSHNAGCASLLQTTKGRAFAPSDTCLDLSVPQKGRAETPQPMGGWQHCFH